MILAAGLLFLFFVFVHQCAGVGRVADDDQPRGAAPCAAVRGVDAGRVPRVGDAQ